MGLGVIRMEATRALPSAQLLRHVEGVTRPESAHVRKHLGFAVIPIDPDLEGFLRTAAIALDGARQKKGGKPPSMGISWLMAGGPDTDDVHRDPSTIPDDAPDTIGEGRPWTVADCCAFAQRGRELLLEACPQSHMISSLHLDEKAVHVHHEMIPLVRSADGQYRVGNLAVREALVRLAPGFERENQQARQALRARKARERLRARKDAAKAEAKPKPRPKRRWRPPKAAERVYLDHHAQLRLIHDLYAERMADFGITRGEGNKQRHHERVDRGRGMQTKLRTIEREAAAAEARRATAEAERERVEAQTQATREAAQKDRDQANADRKREEKAREEIKETYHRLNRAFWRATEHDEKVLDLDLRLEGRHEILDARIDDARRAREGAIDIAIRSLDERREIRAEREAAQKDRDQANADRKREEKAREEIKETYHRLNRAFWRATEHDEKVLDLDLRLEGRHEILDARIDDARRAREGAIDIAIRSLDERREIRAEREAAQKDRDQAVAARKEKEAAAGTLRALAAHTQRQRERILQMALRWRRRRHQWLEAARATKAQRDALAETEGKLDDRAFTLGQREQTEAENRAELGQRERDVKEREEAVQGLEARETTLRSARTAVEADRKRLTAERATAGEIRAQALRDRREIAVQRGGAQRRDEELGERDRKLGAQRGRQEERERNLNARAAHGEARAVEAAEDRKKAQEAQAEAQLLLVTTSGIRLDTTRMKRWSNANRIIATAEAWVRERGKSHGPMHQEQAVRSLRNAWTKATRAEAPRAVVKRDRGREIGE